MNFNSLSLLAAGTLAFAACAVPCRAAMLTITEAMSNSGVTDDWFELTNISNQTVNLTGYTVDDNSFAVGVSVALNNVVQLLPGQSAVFIESAGGANVEAFRSYWSLSATALIGYYSGSGVGLSSAGDGLVVFDSTGTEATPRATFGAATTGSSFYFNTTTGALNGVSAVGQPGVNTSTATYNGAAAATNIGSPTVVPEPAGYVWVSVAGAVALAFVRRRRQQTA